MPRDVYISRLRFAFFSLAPLVVSFSLAEGLVDTETLIKGLRSGVIRQAGLDVYENEAPYFFKDCSNTPVQVRHRIHYLLADWLAGWLAAAARSFVGSPTRSLARCACMCVLAVWWLPYTCGARYHTTPDESTFKARPVSQQGECDVCAFAGRFVIAVHAWHKIPHPAGCLCSLARSMCVHVFAVL